MTQPLGTDLLFRFYFKKLGVPYNPIPAPTLTMEIPDGTQTTPALTSVRAGEYSYTLPAASVTLAGAYVATATTTDATADYFASVATWEVGTNDVISIWSALTTALTALGSIGKLLVDNIDAAISSRLAPTVVNRALDVSATGEAGIDWSNIGAPTTAVDLSNTTIKNVGEGITVADIWNAANADYALPGSQSALLASIKSDTTKIGDGRIIVNTPVNPDTGLTTLVRGSSYMLEDTRSISYAVASFPDLTIGQPAFWHAHKVNRGGSETIEGIITAVKTVRFELTADQTRQLATGTYSISLDSANENPLRTPNNTLIILESD